MDRDQADAEFVARDLAAKSAAAEAIARSYSAAEIQTLINQAMKAAQAGQAGLADTLCQQLGQITEELAEMRQERAAATRTLVTLTDQIQSIVTALRDIDGELTLIVCNLP